MRRRMEALDAGGGIMKVVSGEWVEMDFRDREMVRSARASDRLVLQNKCTPLDSWPAYVDSRLPAPISFSRDEKTDNGKWVS